LFSIGNSFKQTWAALGKKVGFVSDGASVMIGKSNSVAAKLKKKKT
jgi:hypothetical protein